jgi:predicted dehydrogenase
VTSTGEAPGTNRFEIVGTRGKLVLENNKLHFTRNEADMIEFSKSAKVGFSKPDVWNCEIPFDNAPNAHAILMQNFVNAILDGERLIAPGEEGMGSVELANVILYSSLRESWVPSSASTGLSPIGIAPRLTMPAAAGGPPGRARAEACC